VGDCFIGVLPFFHSFGFTGTLWLPLLQSCKAVITESDRAKTIGELAATYRANMLISTPTFCQILKKCTKEQFAHLYAMVGAENCASRWRRRSRRNSCRCWKATAAPKCRRSSP
jgi:acyl-[acyl-carrier-protein]-phospholipid O-acyltransferase/long-chain-fatty-acid--[acyl-carrier-protein] ligase